MTVNILGTEYTVIFATEDDYAALKDSDGITDTSSKEIYIDSGAKTEGDPMRKRNFEGYKKQCLRHEIVHAFLAESGLDGNGHSPDHWEHNEEMVDWFAIQGPKIYAAWQEAGAL